mgnify:CR=1 FL=1
MILFPPWFLAGIVYGGIAIAAAGATGLVILLVRDYYRSTLW